MNGDVKYIQGQLYTELNGKYYLIPMPVQRVGGGRGATGATGATGASGANAPSFQATATGDITTTSVTDVVATGMTLTPAAGTYLVWFSGSVMNDAAAAGLVFASIYLNGVQVPSSEERQGGTLRGLEDAFNSVAKVTVDGTQTIEGRWRVDSGTGTMHQRNLTILQVAP